MNERDKVTAGHRRRTAVVYVRQSTMAQVECHRESTDRQYALVEQARRLGWAREQIAVIDDDLGLSGASTSHRNGFARMTAEVALGRVGIVLGLEVSRLARNNADWYRLLDLCGMTDTLIGDADGVYHPGAFNDRLVLGLKGTMSEAELHVLRARLEGGIRNKAARGELRRALPVGLVWGDADGEVRFHPDEAVTGVIRLVFERFAELGSVRRVWLWLRSQNLAFPSQIGPSGEIRWGSPTYTAIHRVLTNPVYAGAYAYGKSRHERYVDDQGVVRQRVRRLPRAEWAVFLPDHHEGFIDWSTYEANQARIGANTRPQPHQSGGAVREGAALLQGIATCGHCGRRLRTHYRGTNATPGYHCAGKHIVEGRGVYCLSVGGVQIDQAVSRALLEAVQPAAIEAALAAAEQLEADGDAALAQWRREVERKRYRAQRAERRYRAVDPDNRLVARGLEAEWEQGLRDLAQAEAELARREQQRRRTVPPVDRRRCAHSGPICAACGQRQRRAIAIARDCCAACSRRSSSPSIGPSSEPISPCAGAAARSPSSKSVCRAPIRQRCAPMKTPSLWFVGWPPTIPTRSSPASSTVKAAGPPAAIASPPRWSAICAAPGRSPASCLPLIRPRGNWSTSAKRPRSSALPPPRPIAGSMTGSSPASSSPRARPGGSVSPTISAASSSIRSPTATCPCATPSIVSGCHARPCCSVSSAASSLRFTFAAAREKACVSE